MNKQIKNVLIAIFSILLLCISLLYVFARFVFLAPFCYGSNDDLTDTENYLIKNAVLAAVADRCSVLSAPNGQLYDPSYDDEIVQLSSPSSSKKLFICINSDFMNSFKKYSEHEYVGIIQTYCLEDGFEDCIYEFRLDGSNDFKITFWGIDP